DIGLSPASVNENQPVGTTVGTFSTTDADAGDVASYSLVAGTGSSDNGSFQLTGSTLQTSAVFDFESKASYSIRVRSTDGGGLLFEKALTITVTNLNETPVAQGQTVTTNEDTPLTITLQASDPDNDPLSYIVTALPAAGTGSLHAGATVAAPVISVVPATLPGNQVTY